MFFFYINNLINIINNNLTKD